MNIFDVFKYLPVIMQLLNVIPKIEAALAAKMSVIDIIKLEAPEILPLLQQLGQAFFPDVSSTVVANAGALLLSPNTIKTVQTQINALGITDDAGHALTVDGSYGKLTQQAVTKFQSENGLTTDGWAGSETTAALATAVAKLPAST